MRATQAVKSGSSTPIRSHESASGHHSPRMRRVPSSGAGAGRTRRTSSLGRDVDPSPARLAGRTRSPYRPRAMPLLAHLTGPDLGLVTALFLAAAVLANLGLRWLARQRK